MAHTGAEDLICNFASGTHPNQLVLVCLLSMTDARSALSEQDILKKIEETRKRFRIEYAQDSSDKYDSRDVDRLWKDDVLVDGYLEWRHFEVEETLKMIDESLQWRKEFKLNDINESSVQKSLFESGMHYLHGYDKEGNKLFWFRVKLHVKDVKMLTEKKRYVAFWLESYARREPGIPLTVIFDMSEAGLSCIDMDLIKYIINCFQVYYPRLLSKMLMYEMPWIMNAAWKMVKNMLSQDAIDKLKTHSNSVTHRCLMTSSRTPYQRLDKRMTLSQRMMTWRPRTPWSRALLYSEPEMLSFIPPYDTPWF